HVQVIAPLTGGDEAEPVAGAADGEAERRIQWQARRDAHGCAALERDANEMADLVSVVLLVIVNKTAVGPQEARSDPGRAPRQRSETATRHVPRVELERAGHVARDETSHRRSRSDLHAEDARHAKAHLPPELV